MLGDSIAAALEKIGVTPAAVSQWVGRPCGCDERKAKLNQLHFWAARVLSGRTSNAKRFLARIMSEGVDFPQENPPVPNEPQ